MTAPTQAQQAMLRNLAVYDRYGADDPIHFDTRDGRTVRMLRAMYRAGLIIAWEDAEDERLWWAALPPGISMTGYRPAYTVRKQSSGWTFSETFYVWSRKGGGRVSVHAGTRESAQADADQLNIGALVLPFEDDPRPYEARRAEAEAAYLAWKIGAK